MTEWNRDTPWRQGHLLSSEAIEALKLRHSEHLDNTVVAVATHDCDLAQSPEFEPNIEVVVGYLVNKDGKDGNCTHAKNARRLHLEYAGNVSFWVEFDAIAKVSITKQDLNKYAPRSDNHLTPENHAIFQMWLASRYRRSAFADEFERRLIKETKLSEKIAKAVKPHGQLIVGVFFDVDSGEEIKRNGPDEVYILDIIILHAADPSEEARAAAVKVVNDIKDEFTKKLFDQNKGWQQIELRFCEEISEASLSYQQFRQLKRWRLDHMSLAAYPQQPVIAE